MAKIDYDIFGLRDCQCFYCNETKPKCLLVEVEAYESQPVCLDCLKEIINILK